MRLNTKFCVRVLFFLIMAATSVWLGSCSRKDATSKVPEPMTVRVRKVRVTNQPVAVSASCTVEPEDTSKVAFQIPGKVVRVAVREGDAVRTGQLLAEIDPSDYRHAAEAAAAQLALAKSGVEEAKVAYAQAADEYQRMKKLYDRKSLAPNDFKKFEAAYLAARERYGAVVEGEGGNPRGAVAALKQAEAQEKIARKRLADTQLLATINGFVGKKLIEVGDTVAAGYPVFVLVNLNPVKVRAGVPEADIGKVRAGQSASIQIPALGEEHFEGKVTLVGVAAESASRTFTVEIKVPNPHTILRAGMIAEAQIRTDERTNALTLPGEAIVRDTQGATLVYVYYPDQKRVFSRRVEVGSVHDREVEIVKGLDEHDLVVVAGQQRATEGMPVNALEVQL